MGRPARKRSLSEPALQSMLPSGSPNTHTDPLPATPPLSPPPPRALADAERRLAGRLRHELGVRGAASILRRHGFERVRAVLEDPPDMSGVRNPGAFIHWLIEQEASADETQTA